MVIKNLERILVIGSWYLFSLPKNKLSLLPATAESLHKFRKCFAFVFPITKEF